MKTQENQTDANADPASRTFPLAESSLLHTFDAIKADMASAYLSPRVQLAFRVVVFSLILY